MDMDKRRDSFKKALEQVINSHSMENGSNTPDWILAEFLVGALEMFDISVNARERSRGRVAPVDMPEGPALSQTTVDQLNNIWRDGDPPVRAYLSRQDYHPASLSGQVARNAYLAGWDDAHKGLNPPPTPVETTQGPIKFYCAHPMMQLSHINDKSYVHCPLCREVWEAKPDPNTLKDPRIIRG